ncbi:hypothetical protein GCM10010300_79280 [Streptomyces olivaceoviridis]|nr:hypothetical protein GCM10010300_79280 [Streptomyces olivaceoviridis]
MPGQNPTWTTGGPRRAATIDLDLFAGPQRHGGGEGPPLEAGRGGPDCSGGQFAGAGHVAAAVAPEIPRRPDAGTKVAASWPAVAFD